MTANTTVNALRAEVRRLSARLLAVLLLGTACSPDVPPAPGVAPDPVLLIGLDGMEWNVVLEMLREHRLPNLERLMSEGVRGELETFSPAKSPVVWTSVATGVVPERHGIEGFVKHGDDWNRESTGEDLYTSRDRRTKALWNILTDVGKRSYVVGWWTTYPAEEIDGVLVAQVSTVEPDRFLLDQPRMKGGLLPGMAGQIHPPEREEALFALLGEVEQELPALSRETFGDFPADADALGRKLWEGCRWALRCDAVYHRITLHLLGEGEPFDFCAVYFGGADVFGHRFWRYAYPESFAHPPSPEELKLFGDFVKSYYALLDRMVGELVAASPERCNVMLVSDHGMRAGGRKKRFRADLPLGLITSGQHRAGPPSFFLARGPAFAASAAPGDSARESVRRLGSILDIAPTVLTLLGLPVGRDMDGRVLEATLAPSFLERHTVRFVETHTPADWYESRGGQDVTFPRSEERLEQLRALGYLD